MTSFKFNFSGNTDDLHEKDKEEIKWFDSEEVIPSHQVKEIKDLLSHAKMFVCGDVEIGHVSVNNMITYLKYKGIGTVLELAEKKHSDLVTGKYEGGLKIWECTYDLIEYFEDNSKTIMFKNKKVLDLGCGAGILGIYSLLKGGIATFQDYNKEIVQYSTIPNVYLNFEEEELSAEIKKCKFYSGDWASFNKLLDESEKFDIILTSETLYNPSNYNKLISLFKDRLSDNGDIFIASKTYYFGVGGGTRQFETAIKDSSLDNEVIWKTTNGIQREILKIKHS
ncbi:histidine protein methyltransferase 1 homolog [Melitaea cinxia]|uniref:histidine protein methyltransferase 1 homolog n=1 Tax=Melitaea cinxia TaxID=113334 RepID=UPI001E274A9E|nr:histidine protein methyltransferase 1 homolog [Melitaea cinxia]